jgi:nitrite transporter NirC
LLVSVSAPLAASGNAATKLVQGAVFGLALTLVVFAGGELFTGNAMTMLQGWRDRLVRPGQLAAVWAASLFGNLVGSVLLAGAVNAGGTLEGHGAALIATMVATKDALTGGQLFWRAVLCNALVCLALWMAARTRSDGAKLAVLWWALLAFIGSSFEHSVANMTLFALGVFQGSASWDQLAHNLAWTVPGNVVGGGLVVGLGYAWAGRTRRSATSSVTVPLQVSVDGGPTPSPAPAPAIAALAAEPVAVGRHGG